MRFFGFLRHEKDGGKNASLGFVKRIRNGVYYFNGEKYFKQNGAPYLFMTSNKSTSKIKEIILEIRFPKQKNWRVIFQCEHRVQLFQERDEVPTDTEALGLGTVGPCPKTSLGTTYRLINGFDV
ncbi:hypothetical protein TNCV_799131 [Trichonephila clavipes]|nr:hypothetical protein TNCV_799131 [Trichonephila clavipes]